MSLASAVSILGAIGSLLCAIWGFLTFKHEVKEGGRGGKWRRAPLHERRETAELMHRDFLLAWRPGQYESPRSLPDAQIAHHILAGLLDQLDCSPAVGYPMPHLSTLLASI